MPKYLKHIELPNGEVLYPVNDNFSFEAQYSPINWNIYGIPVVDATDRIIENSCPYNLVFANAITPLIKMFLNKEIQNGTFMAEVESDLPIPFIDSDNQLVQCPSFDGVCTYSLDKPIKAIFNSFSGNPYNAGLPILHSIYSFPRLIKDEQGKTNITALFSRLYALDYINSEILSQYDIEDATLAFFDNSATELTLPIGSNTCINATFMDNKSYLSKITFTKSKAIEGTGYVSDMIGTFYDCESLTTINCSSDDISFANVSDTTLAFCNCIKLEHINGKFLKDLKVSVSFASCPLLSRDAILNIFSNVADLKGSGPREIYLHPDAYARLSEEDIAVATKKNWLIRVAENIGEEFEIDNVLYRIIDGDIAEIVEINKDIVGDLSLSAGVIFNQMSYRVGVLGLESGIYISNLKSIHLPQSLYIILGGALCDCQSLEDITLPDSVHFIGNSTFMRAKSFKKHIIPNNIKEVPSGYLQECSILESLTIPKSVVRVGHFILNGCSKLTELICLAEQPSVCQEFTFYGCPTAKAVLKVPKGSKELYEKAYGWSNFKNIVELEETE